MESGNIVNLSSYGLAGKMRWFVIFSKCDRYFYTNLAFTWKSFLLRKGPADYTNRLKHFCILFPFQELPTVAPVYVFLGALRRIRKVTWKTEDLPRTVIRTRWSKHWFAHACWMSSLLICAAASVCSVLFDCFASITLLPENSKKYQLTCFAKF